MKNPLKSPLAPALLALAAFAAAILTYPRLPSEMASHFNAYGQPDGTSSKFWGAFGFPLIILAVTTLLVLVPKIDPKRRNIEKFKPQYHQFITIITGFMLYIYGLILAWNLGLRFNFNLWLLPSFSVLTYGIGGLVGAAEPNWTIGIRTPWTLSSETVWKKTHALGGKLLKFAAFVVLAGLAWPSLAIWFSIAPLLGSIIFLVAYSYFQYQKHGQAAG